MFQARPGGGASPAGDGWESAGEGQAAGGIKFGSIEVAEARFPLFFEHHEFRPDSGGAGRYRGGVGGVLRFRVETEEAGIANTAGDGVRHAPYGILGGRDGLPHRYRLVSGRTERVLRTKEVGVPVRPGDLFLVESGGGGGYGPPEERDPRAHAEDLANGFVTARPLRGAARRPAAAAGNSASRRAPRPRRTRRA
jgi:N-methylhydantoinase B